MPNEPVTAVLLAAGRSSRMGDINKLTRDWKGKPLVRHAAEAVAGAGFNRYIAVLGHEAEAVRRALPDGFPTIPNHEYRGGMAGSIRCGLYGLQGYAPVMIVLGDMPLISAPMLDAMIAQFKDAEDDAIMVACADGQWGNPVLFGRPHFRALKLLKGDSGARAVIEANSDRVIEMEFGDAARRDFDTVEAFGA